MFYIDTGIKSDERYDMAKFMEYANSAFDPLTSFFLLELSKLTVRGEYVVLNEEYRPDLISQRFYGTVDFWFIILAYNDLLSPQELVTGTKINLPGEEDINDLFFRLRTFEQRQGVS